MERARRGAASVPARAAAQARGGDPNRPGQNSGAGRSAGEWRGGWASDGSLGDGRWRGNLAPVGADRAVRERMERALESGAAEVPRLTQRIRSTETFDPKDILALRQFARELGDGRFHGNPALLEQEYRKMMALLEQLEVQLAPAGRAGRQARGSCDRHRDGSGTVPRSGRRILPEAGRLALGLPGPRSAAD